MKRLQPIVILLAVCGSVPIEAGQVAKRPFTVAGEIGVTLFDDLAGGLPGKAVFSSDGRYFAVWSERGDLRLNRVEDSLRFYRTKDIEGFVREPEPRKAPLPAWVVQCSDTEGAVINDWRWLPDSSGVVFLQGGRVAGDRQL